MHRHCTFGLLHRGILNSRGMVSVPAKQPTTRAIRFAVSAGTLTPPRIQRRRVEAEQRGVHLVDVLTEAELMHLQLIQKVLPPGATWADAVEVIMRQEPGKS